MATNLLTSNDDTPVPTVVVPLTDPLIIGTSKDGVQTLTNLCRKELVERLAETLVHQIDACLWAAYRQHTGNADLTLSDLRARGTRVQQGQAEAYYWDNKPVARVLPPEFRESGGRLEVSQCVERLSGGSAQCDRATHVQNLT